MSVSLLAVLGLDRFNYWHGIDEVLSRRMLVDDRVIACRKIKLRDVSCLH
jgi:hypothetical protein